jgi:HEPN domain-containing protein
VEVPHVHDVAFLLAEHADRLPPALAAHIERLVSISRRLRQEREISFYGNEELGAPADRLYSADDAAQALGDARLVIELAIAHVP